MKTQKTHCNVASKVALQGYGPAISAYKEGIVWWSQGSLRRHKCNVRRIRFRVSPVYIGWFVPSLERLENLLDFVLRAGLKTHPLWGRGIRILKSVHVGFRSYSFVESV